MNFPIYLSDEEKSLALVAIQTIRAILEGKKTDLHDWSENIYGENDSDIEILLRVESKLTETPDGI